MQRPGRATLGIVLAGGRSMRLGPAVPAAGGKATLTFHGKTFLEHVVAAVSAVTTRTIVVAAPGQTLPQIDGVEIVRDTLPGAGPLAGIRDGLGAALADYHGTTSPPRLAFVASCDLPLLRPAIVRLLVEAAEESGALWTVPVVNGHRQALVSVIDVGLQPRIEAWLATGRRDPRGLIADLAGDDVAVEEPRSLREVPEEACLAVDPELVSFDDIDTPADLARLQTR